VSAFPRDAYRGLARYAPDREPVEVDLCDNTNLWGAHPAALEVAHGAAAESLIRYPAVYADALRDGIARKFGIDLAAVATGCGSDDLLDSTFRAVCEPGDRVVFLEPTFSMIEPFAAMNALESVPLAGWPAPPEPERLLDCRPALVYLCSPNNPTGASLERGWIERLLAAAGPDGPIVLVDEAYVDFAGDAKAAEDAKDGEDAGDARDTEYDEGAGKEGEREGRRDVPQAASLLRMAPESDRLLVLRTFSKAYGLAGLRVGFAAGPPDVIAEVEKSRGPYKVGNLAERAALAALEDRAGWVPDVVRAVRENRARLVRELEARGFEPLPSDANFVLLPLPPRWKGHDAQETSQRLRARQVAVRPFPALPGIGEAFRVTIGPWPLLERFLAALDDVAAETEAAE
jgi:histidinol-phosphate/aromatic aminotransferase/cobyric acid decarboxylase-like protein